MIQQLGQQIRQLRKRKGIGLNEFAKELEVPTGYLSNLETGKSDTIKLDVLERIQGELKILPLVTFQTSYSQRIARIEQNIVELEHIDPFMQSI